MVKGAFFALLCAITPVLGERIRFAVIYRLPDGHLGQEYRNSGLADTQVQNVIRNMRRWSNRKYEAVIVHGILEVRNIQPVANLDAGLYMFHEMYMFIANNIPRQMPDPPEV